MENFARAAINNNDHTCLSTSSRARQQEKLTSYCRAVDYLQAKYAIEDKIAGQTGTSRTASSLLASTQSSMRKNFRQKTHAAGLCETEIASMEHSSKE